MLPYVWVKSTSQEGRELNRSAKRVFDSLSGNVLLNNPNLVTDMPLGTTDTVINHGLGRVPLGYIIVGLNAPETVYTSSTVNDTPTANIILKASGNVIATILFF